MHESRSLAVWCVPKPGIQGSPIEVHVNYWRVEGAQSLRLKSKNRQRDFLEIGVMVTIPQNIANIAIFIPEKIEKSQVSDVSNLFVKQEIAQGIFNESLTSTNVNSTNTVPSHVKLELSGSLYCRVHKFITANGVIDQAQLSITPESDGVLVRILDDALLEACRGLQLGEKVYFRLRVAVGNKTGSSILQKLKIADKGLQSGYTQVEYLDFRMNEARTLPQSIDAMMRRENAVASTTTLIAFLTAIPVESDLVGYKTAANKTRLLEHQIWNDYMDGDLPQGMVVYHWKRENATNGVIDFSTFLKMQTRKSDWVTILVYLMIAFLFGLSGNIAASYIQERLPGSKAERPSIAVTIAPNTRWAGSAKAQPIAVITDDGQGK